ncbi:hypothetical protein Sjap_009800 [Stephania japonica]|uniref:Uncharacterized protein n=1 Tax=Stephania japonica TaxID=461633 RepID=A0AAP0J8D9_9MAGN
MLLISSVPKMLEQAVFVVDNPPEGHTRPGGGIPTDIRGNLTCLNVPIPAATLGVVSTPPETIRADTPSLDQAQPHTQDPNLVAHDDEPHYQAQHDKSVSSVANVISHFLADHGPVSGLPSANSVQAHMSAPLVNPLKTGIEMQRLVREAHAFFSSWLLTFQAAESNQVPRDDRGGGNLVRKQPKTVRFNIGEIQRASTDGDPGLGTNTLNANLETIDPLEESLIVDGNRANEQ